MSAAAVTILVLVALVVVGGVVWYFVSQRRRTEALQARYGPEYSRMVGETGDARRAEEELVKRKERVDHLDIRPLRAEQREQFLTRWIMYLSSLSLLDKLRWSEVCLQQIISFRRTT